MRARHRRRAHAREVKLALGTSAHDPTDPVERLLFDVLAMVAEFEAGLIRAHARGHEASSPSSSPIQEAHLAGLYRAGEHTVGELEELFGVHPLDGVPRRPAPRAPRTLR